MIDFEAAKNEILEWVAEAIRVPVEQIDLNKPLAEIGLDSLDAVHMIATIESTIRQDLPEGFQSAEFQRDNGFIDMVVNRSELKHTIAHLLRLLTS